MAHLAPQSGYVAAVSLTMTELVPTWDSPTSSSPHFYCSHVVCTLALASPNLRCYFQQAPIPVSLAPPLLATTLIYHLYPQTAPFIFSAPFKVHYISTRRPSCSVRAIIFHQPRLSDNRLRPLHLDVHGGAFLGGLAEYDATFCKLLADGTGAVVVSTQYRCAPAHTFPAAHEDVEDVARWLLANAEEKLGADPELMTVSGFSAGANLALGIS